MKWFEKNKSDTEVKAFLHEYFKDHPTEEMASVGKEVTCLLRPSLHTFLIRPLLSYSLSVSIPAHMCLVHWHAYRCNSIGGVWSRCACMLASRLRKIDDLRDLLERGGTQLTGSQHLMAVVPKIELFEFARLVKELEGQRVCIIYDGTTRLGECVAVLLRWCPVDFAKIEQRLVALRTTETHMNGGELGALLMDILGGCGVRSTNVVCGARDARVARTQWPTATCSPCSSTWRASSASRIPSRTAASMSTCRSSTSG